MSWKGGGIEEFGDGLAGEAWFFDRATNDGWARGATKWNENDVAAF